MCLLNINNFGKGNPGKELVMIKNTDVEKYLGIVVGNVRKK